MMQDSNVWEKAGVNISVVNGTLPPAAAEQIRVRSDFVCFVKAERK